MKHAIAALAALILSALTLLSPAQAAEPSCGEPTAKTDHLSLAKPTFSSTQLRNGETGLVTLATLRNDSDAAVEEVLIEVKYFDAQKAHIDTITEEAYVQLPAHGETGIRIRGLAAKPAESYAAQELRIVSATAGSHCDNAGASKPNWFVSLLISWGPLMVLVIIMIWYSRSKSTPTNRVVALYARQLELVEKQNELLGRIADSSERRSPPSA